ncbi:replication restart helicase PriA [Nitrospira lenta]|uniref:Probable replication restart protein PriA n=1 Tax=Nitrospira lenta TaxID=1436998 RepID=A0A330LBP5_9BACT|nr:primosomal protein N' [Nitrospira lenta]SPP64449.1 putative Primosomal protein N [Nitrospira lenta]
MPTEFHHAINRPNVPVFANVIVPRHLTKTFTYLVPPALVNRVVVGQRVVVPFGRTTLEGAVIGLTGDLPGGVNVSQLKAIASVSDSDDLSGFPPGMFELSRQVAEEYIAPWGQCLRLVSSPASKVDRPKYCYMATEEGRLALAQGKCPEAHLPLFKRIARRKSGLSASTIQLSRRGSDRQALTFLEAQQWIVRSEAAVSKRASRAREDMHERELPSCEGFSYLSPDSDVVRRIQALIQAAQAARVLIDGMLDYRLGLMARAAQIAVEQGRSALIIVGEVVRAQWLAQALREITNCPVALHPHRVSGADVELDRKGVPHIIVGTRSAIFYPLRSIGLIWVDGEDSSALKEPQEPHYHAREVAWMRAQQGAALLVYGSAHPSLEVVNAGEIERFSQKREANSFPSVDVVDMSREYGGVPFSATLVAALRATVAQQDRAILFLNRRGYAGALVCRDCGWVPRCPSCAVAFVYYRESARLACRYCGRKESLPEICGACGASRLSPIGEGTERIEQEVRRLFPGARILRIDRDTTRGVAPTRQLWQQVHARTWDILIGTQALFQREPILPVGLVGIVHADSGLHLPDFRAAERTHQLLVDAVNVARPAPAGGRVILQTSLPMHHVMQAVAAHDPARFYDEEIQARRSLGYPPVQHLIYLTVSGKERRLTELAAQRWVSELQKMLTGRLSATPSGSGSAKLSFSADPQSQGIVVLGPVAATGVGSGGTLGWHIMVKGGDRTVMRNGVRCSLEAMERAYPSRTCKFSVDVDPVDMG